MSGIMQERGRGSAGRQRERFSGVRIGLQELFDRMPPHSEEAEMSLLGSMILDHEVVNEVVPLVSQPDAFYREAHGVIFSALLRLHERHQSGDLVQLTEALKDQAVLEDVGGPEYLVRLAESVPSAVNAPYYARIVREKHQLRRLIDAAGQMLYDAYHVGERGDDGARSVLDDAEQSIIDIAEAAQSVDISSLSQLLQEALDQLMANEGHLVTGLRTGFYELDEMTSGLQPGEMCILAARPSMGKTALALNLAEQIAFGGLAGRTGNDDPRCPVGFFSLEMSKQSVTQRLLSAHSQVDSHRMRTNRLSRDDYARLIDSCGKLSEAPIHVDDTPGLTVMGLRAKARRMARQHGVRCLVIDYLQLMSAPAAVRDGRQQEVSTISRQVKALARELKLPVMCLAQLNRGAEQREGHRPRMADLRESGSIEQDADVVMLLHREEYYHQADPEWADEHPEKVGVAELIIAKQRNGPTGTVKLVWDARTTRFKSYAHPRSDDGYARPPSDAPHASGVIEPRPGNGARPGSFAPGKKTGPIDDHRDGGGPERDWESTDVDDLPI